MAGKMEKRLLYIATGNQHKIEEIAAIVGDRFLVKGLGEFSPKITWDENGDTFEANARIKAQAVKARLKGLRAAILADDSGLEVDALDGRPGVYSARYAGKEGDDAANNAKLLKELGDHPKRSARFVCTLWYIDSEGRESTFRGTCEGAIAKVGKGSHGFGYDPLFLVSGHGVAMAELPPNVKNTISHRAKALHAWLMSNP